MKITITDTSENHVIDVLDLEEFDIESDIGQENLKEELLAIILGYIEDNI